MLLLIISTFVFFTGSFLTSPPIYYVAAEEEPSPITTTSSVVCETIYEYGCSCMVGLVKRGHTYLEGFDAEDLMPNTEEPNNGDVALFFYEHSNIYHAGEVLETYLGSFLMYECNFNPGECGERIVQKDDPNIRGYLHRHE